MSKKPDVIVSTLREFAKQYSGATASLLTDAAAQLEKKHIALVECRRLANAGDETPTGRFTRIYYAADKALK